MSTQETVTPSHLAAADRASVVTETQSPATSGAPGRTGPRDLRARASGVTLAAVRVVVAFLFISHGLLGLIGAFGGVDGQGGALLPGSWPGWWAAILNVVCGGLVLLGLFTRPAALLSSGAMAYAYFFVHQPMALHPLQNGGEPAILFCWIFLLIAVVGPGSYALDALIRRSRRARPTMAG